MMVFFVFFQMFGKIFNCVQFNTAICTSGEPVSLRVLHLSRIISCFLSGVNIVIPPFFCNRQCIETAGAAYLQAMVQNNTLKVYHSFMYQATVFYLKSKFYCFFVFFNLPAKFFHSAELLFGTDIFMKLHRHCFSV